MTHGRLARKASSGNGGITAPPASVFRPRAGRCGSRRWRRRHRPPWLAPKASRMKPSASEFHSANPADHEMAGTLEGDVVHGAGDAVGAPGILEGV